MKQSETVPHNAGASIQDTQVIGPSGQSIQSWREERGIDSSEQVSVVKLVHMRYQHPELDTIVTFLRDFGMVAVKQTDDRAWFRGTSSDSFVYYAQKGPRKFLGGTFEVDTYDDLVKVSKLDRSGAIQCLDEEPGGGFMVTAHDPEGSPINFIHGQVPVDAGQLPEKLIINYESEKPRQKKFQRFQPGPAAVHKVTPQAKTIPSLPSPLPLAPVPSTDSASPAW